MANEIWHHYDSAQTLYARIRRCTDFTVYDVVVGSNTFDTWADVDVDDYDIQMTDRGGGYHTADFPTDITPGNYDVGIFLQPGAVAADDVSIAQARLYWGGDDEIDQGTISTGQNLVSYSYEERASVTRPGELGSIQAQLRS